MVKGILQKAMDRAVGQGVFPGGVLLVARGDEIAGVICAGTTGGGDLSRPVADETVYDLASLTKILSTTILIMLFLEKKRLTLESPLADLWPQPVPEEKKGLTVARMLSHATGLPAWRPYHQSLSRVPPAERRSRMAELILAEPLEARPGQRAIYSDLNFILLGLILERLAGERQDLLFQKYIAETLSLACIGYRPTDRETSPEINLAPTEMMLHRGGLIRGQVHDDNAAALDGVAGHAGLFGTAAEVWKIFKSLRSAYREESGLRLISPETVRRFWRRSNLTPDSTWALGFDTPSRTGSSAGRYFSPASVGHLGYTGVSLWHDPEKDLTVILLSNRVHPRASNQAIRAFRPYIHDLAAEALLVEHQALL